MDFELNEEQAMLREVSRSMLKNHSTTEQVRVLADAGSDVDDKLWQLASELGWTGLALPERFGGSDQGVAELCLVSEELGRSVTPGPFLTTALVGLAVSRDGDEELRQAVLPDLASGAARASWALAEPGGAWTPESVTVTATADGEGYLLSGAKTAVQDAGTATWLLVTALLDGAPASLLVDASAAGVSTRRQTVLDMTRGLYEVTLDNVAVPASHLLGGGAERVRWLADVAAVLTSADALGVGERLLEMTVDYVKVRHQFDRPIGSFQAVKHKCANMLILAQGARAATYYAAMALDADRPDASRAASVAKSFSSEGMSQLAGEALQTHGGIGFTWEHDLHLYLRRAKTDEALYGDSPAHQQRLTDLLLAARA